MKATKKRKPRDTSYSVTQKLLKRFGEQTLYDIWAINGMYTASEKLWCEYGVSASPEVFRYLSKKFMWRRGIATKNLDLPFVKGVMQGTVPASFYKHIIFPGHAQIEQKCDEMNIT